VPDLLGSFLLVDTREMLRRACGLSASSASESKRPTGLSRGRIFSTLIFPKSYALAHDVKRHSVENCDFAESSDPTSPRSTRLVAFNLNATGYWPPFDLLFLFSTGLPPSDDL
jgi:hypothetical protein